MFEIITKIIELLLSGSKRIQEEKVNKRRKEYSKTLLDTYLRLIEVITTGNIIIEELEYYVDRCRRYQARGENIDHGTFNLQIRLNEQGLNLIRLSSSLREASKEMAVFLPDAGEKIYELVSNKRHALWRLANILGQGYCYLGLEPDTTPFLERLRQSQTRSLDDMTEMKLDSVFLDDEWDNRHADKIEAYLAERQPKEQLRILRQSSMELRDLLVKSATLDEILWSVDDFKSSNELIFNDDTERAKLFFDKKLNSSDLTSA